MTGYITKGIGGFYYVKTSEGIVECKPRGIFRKQKITPVAGDVVTLETENGAAVIAGIAPRRNVFVRPVYYPHLTLPTTTCVTLMPAFSRTGTTFAGLKGQEICGSSVERSIS